MAGMLLEDMPRPATLGADTLVSVLAGDAVTMLRGPGADRRALQGVHIIGMAAVTGEAITAWATAIHTTGVAITVGTIRLTAIIRGDTILTATDTGRP
jgi:hypothetical protein